MTGEPLVKVYESQGIFAAEVVKAKLEASGIPAMLKYESVGQIIGITVDGLGRVEVHVPAPFEEDALALVDEAGDNEEPEATGDAWADDEG
jgi:hypothetical protein